MKAIAIFEMPDYCYMCPCCMREEEVDECFCGISFEKIGDIYDDKLKGCPLRPMPEWTINREVAFSNGAPVPDDVVFDFLKEILGETE